MIVVPCIETGHLILRSSLEIDLPAMNDYLSEDCISFIGSPFDEVGKWRALLGPLGHWHPRSFGFWDVKHRKNRKTAGTVGFLHHFERPEPELSWNVHHDFEGKDMAHEATLAARRYGENHLDLRAVIRFIDPASTRSAALARRPGAEFEKSFRLGEHDCHVDGHPKGEPSQRVTQPETNQ